MCCFQNTTVQFYSFKIAMLNGKNLEETFCIVRGLLTQFRFLHFASFCLPPVILEELVPVLGSLSLLGHGLRASGGATGQAAVIQSHDHLEIRLYPECDLPPGQTLPGPLARLHHVAPDHANQLHHDHLLSFLSRISDNFLSVAAP